MIYFVFLLQHLNVSGAVINIHFCPMRTRKLFCTQVRHSSVSHAIVVVMNRAHITLIQIPGQPDLRLLHFPGLPLLPHWGYARYRVLQAISTNPFEDRTQLTSATASRSHCNGPDYNLLAGLHV